MRGLTGGHQDVRQRVIAGLAERLREREERWRQAAGGDGSRELRREIETGFGLLKRRRLHEWFGVDECRPPEIRAGEAEDGKRRARREAGRQARQQCWSPPCAIFLHVAHQAWRDSGERGLLLWIGRAVWPYPVHLSDRELSSCIFIDPQGSAGVNHPSSARMRAPSRAHACELDARVRAIDIALQSPAVTAVIADGSGLTLQQTRRLQLAAERGRAMALLARPVHELAQRSAAAFRWRVSTVEEKSQSPRFCVELIRSKDATAMARSGRRIKTMVEWRYGQGLVTVPAVVADRTAGAAARHVA